MSITSYFTQRSNKVINSDLMPQCSPYPFGILGINNSNPHHADNPLQNKDNSRLSCSWTLPIGLANMEEREEQENKENKENKVLKAPKKAEHSQETAHTLLITLMNLMPHFHPAQWCDDDNDIFTDALRTPQDEAENEGEEGTAVAAPVAKKRRASNPYHHGYCGTLLFSSLCHQYPKDLPRVHPFHQGVVAADSKEERNWGRV